MHYVNFGMSSAPLPKQRFLLMLLLISMIGAAQQPVPFTIKGHHLGESTEVFILEEPKLSPVVAQCRANRPQLATPEVIEQMPKSEFSSFSMSLMLQPGWKSKIPSRQEVVKHIQSGEKLYVDKRDQLLRSECDAYATVGLGTGDLIPFGFDDLLNHPEVTYSFVDKHLVKISFNLKRSDFESAFTDLGTKLNATASVSHPEMYNAMGARWKDDEAIWKTDLACAVLTGSNNPASQLAILSIETKENCNAELNKPPTHPLE